MNDLKVLRPKKSLITREIVVSILFGYFVLLPLVVIIDHVFKLNLNLGAGILGLAGASIGIRTASKSYKTDRSIVLSEKGISGKEFLGRKRISILFQDIDREKTRKRNLIEYLIGTHNIIDKDNYRLEFFRRIFTKEDVSYVLNKCEIAPNNLIKRTENTSVLPDKQNQ